MKAPDKIYLERDYPDNGVLPIGLHYSPSQSDIQYIRKDALVRWIESIRLEYDLREQFDRGANSAMEHVLQRINSL